ncbi:myosin heavy chain, embryonic smooth muscle isoform-like [Chenopodium quinoa]|uniref:myosin heavy chain, embryonic smooth muscle isoform-like n=1 Tax=Chenopodium quinoa TaxID=63459 RepID=UPI000B77381B|nr:myosin heavy chain, embryonic smooth muscle isoform-like [Chenopodium quinoa]
MAKKKTTHQTQTPQNPTKMEENNHQTTAAIDDPSANDKDKLKSLHSLNAMLLKETVEKRQEIKSLDSELTRCKSEVEALRAELTRVKDEGAEVEVVKEVVSVFMESEMVGLLRREKEGVEKRLEEVEREMGVVVKERDEMEKAKFDGDYEIGLMKKLENDLRNEIRREKEGVNQAIRERNELNHELGVRAEEINRLREKIGVAESKERSVVKELEGLKVKYEVSAKVVKEKEEEVERMRSELGLMEKNREGLKGEIEGLSGEKEAVSRANDELCDERRKSNVRINELEKEVDQLNGVVLSVREDEEKWREKFFELEKSNAGTVAELEEAKKGLSDLLEEKNERKREMERLKGEKSSVEARLGELEKELESAKQVREELVELESKFKEVSNVVSGLKNELLEVQGELSLVKESNTNNVELNKKLASEIDDHKSELTRVTKERDEVRKTLDEEKKNGMTLQVKVSEISKKMEDTAKVIEGLRTASDSLVGEKKEIESKYNKLKEDKELIEKDFATHKGVVNELEDTMKAKTEMFELVVSMVRNTVTQLSMENEKRGDDAGIKANERSISGELKPILSELEAMRSVFKKRDEKVGEVQQKMESLQYSLLEERKKKSFWTLVSSATTILAAVVSFAYASRVR